jgi:hypothetical protein
LAASVTPLSVLYFDLSLPSVIYLYFVIIFAFPLFFLFTLLRSKTFTQVHTSRRLISAMRPKFAAVALLRLGTTMFPLLLVAVQFTGSAQRALVAKVLASYAGIIFAFIGGLLQAAALVDGKDFQTLNVVLGIGLALVGFVSSVAAWVVPSVTAPSLLVLALSYGLFAYYERFYLSIAPKAQAVLMSKERLACHVIACVTLLLAAVLVH